MTTQELYPGLFSAPRDPMWSVSDFVDSLPQLDVKELPENDRRCPHCWNDFGEEFGEEIDEKEDWRRILRDFKELPFCRSTPCNDPVQLPCGHVFGLTCLVDIFLKVGSSCPMCRRDYEEYAQRELNRIFFQNLTPRDIRKKSWEELRLCFHKLIIVPERMKADWEEHWKNSILHRPFILQGESGESDAELLAKTESVQRVAFKVLDAYAWRLPAIYTPCTAYLVTQMIKYAHIKALEDPSIGELAAYCLHLSFWSLCRIHALRQSWETVHKAVENECSSSKNGVPNDILNMLVERYGYDLDKLFDDKAIRTSRLTDYFLMRIYYQHCIELKLFEDTETTCIVPRNLIGPKVTEQVVAIGNERRTRVLPLILEAAKKIGEDVYSKPPFYADYYYLFSTVPSDCALGDESTLHQRRASARGHRSYTV